MFRATKREVPRWPSLILGTAGTGTSLHTDAWATNFWMGQLAGRKKWTLYSTASDEDKLDALLGRNEYTGSFDAERREQMKGASRLHSVEVISDPKLMDLMGKPFFPKLENWSNGACRGCQ